MKKMNIYRFSFPNLDRTKICADKGLPYTRKNYEMYEKELKVALVEAGFVNFVVEPIPLEKRDQSYPNWWNKDSYYYQKHETSLPLLTGPMFEDIETVTNNLQISLEKHAPNFIKYCNEVVVSVAFVCEFPVSTCAINF